MTGMQAIDALRTVVSAMSGSDSESADNSHQGAVRKGIRITASAATILAAHSRMSKGEDPVAPDENLGHAANFLYMLLGKVPDGNDGRASTRPSSCTLSTAQMPPRSLPEPSLLLEPTCSPP